MDISLKHSINSLYFNMKRLLLLSIFAVFATLCLHAQYETYGVRMVVLEWNGELVGNGDMDDVVIKAAKPTEKEMKSAQKKMERYDKVRWNVHKVYPYAVGVADLLKQVDKVTATMTSESEKKSYLEKQQKVMFAEYEDDIRRMTTQQGKILLKLIARQTGRSAYSLIKDTKSGATAFFWNGVGGLFGIDLKADFNREEDGLIEEFARELDRGSYNIFWKENNYRFKSL